MPKDLSFAERALQESTAARRPGNPGPAAESESDERPESSITTRTSNQPTLQLRFKDGRESAVPYPYITWYDYDPAKGITLETPAHDVHIEGTGLSFVFRQIASHKRQIVDELSSPGKTLAANEVRSHVAAIRVTPHKNNMVAQKPAAKSTDLSMTNQPLDGPEDLRFEEMGEDDIGNVEGTA
jgi:hypothetical protein